ncbi:MAG TPA: tRNA pseudouridine(55) synthase TruB [Clostridia bacterium]|nr:tRNA pseudouridine(55) synthase TruB [Clostridia bacterium]
MEGVVNVLKPPGMTSSDVVTDIRHIFSMKRVGHTGTLDPGAAGVLPVCLGRATRLFDRLTDKKKEYIAEVAFGTETDTQDAYGAVVRRLDVQVHKEALINILPRFVGEQMQTVPKYAAVRVNGTPMYKLARSGEEVEQKKRPITVHEITFLHQTGENSYLLRVSCSRGTYVRALCSDIGAALNTCAHLSFLLRTSSGMFTLENAYTLEELRAMKESGELLSAVIPVDKALHDIPEMHIRDLSEREKRLLLNGASIERGEEFQMGETVKVYLDGRFIALGERGEDGFHCTVFFTGEESDGA